MAKSDDVENNVEKAKFTEVNLLGLDLTFQPKYVQFIVAAVSVFVFYLAYGYFQVRIKIKIFFLWRKQFDGKLPQTLKIEERVKVALIPGTKITECKC